MTRIIEILKKNNIECLPSERFTLDVEMFPEYEEEHNFPKQVLFETPELTGGKKKITESNHSYFRYFLDGSQRSYRVIDATFNKRYLPICGGQIGVAILERNEGSQFKPIRELTKIENIIAFPNDLDGYYLKQIEDQINSQITRPFRLIQYDSKKEEKDPADLARAMIISEMQRLELSTIRKMIKENLITDTKWLAKDGSLQYRDEKIKDLDISKDDQVQLRYVIGLSKSFSPNLTLGIGRKKEDVGNLTKGLDWKERSTVISPNKDEKTTHAWWYLRIRPRDKIYYPLQGIVKIEVFVDDSEKFNDGISRSRADTIASHVLLERNVTPFKADNRWASHLYPIYLTENYLKSSFLSHDRFKALII
jgi:hypothetical protein